MNEYYKSQLLKIDDNLYFMPDFKGFYEEIDGDYQRIDLTSDKSAIDLKLRNKLIKKYKKKIKEAYYLKYEL